MPINFPTAAELDQGFLAYEAEMAARRLNPLPPEPRDGDEDRVPRPDQIYCDLCGKVFTHAHRQVALMLRGRHRKEHHAESVEAY